MAQSYLVFPRAVRHSPTSRLSCMLRSSNMWAQADAVGCLGWLVGNGMPSHTLQKLIPAVTLLLSKHNGCSLGLSDCNGGEGRTQNIGDGRRGQGDRQRVEDAERRQEVALERMDNLRVYSLIFLLKVPHYLYYCIFSTFICSLCKPLRFY